MSHPTTVWCIIAGVLLCSFLFKAFKRYYLKYSRHENSHLHIIEVGKDKNIFYIPGDIDDEDDFGD